MVKNWTAKKIFLVNLSDINMGCIPSCLTRLVKMLKSYFKQPLRIHWHPKKIHKIQIRNYDIQQLELSNAAKYSWQIILSFSGILLSNELTMITESQNVKTRSGPSENVRFLDHKLGTLLQISVWKMWWNFIPGMRASKIPMNKFLDVCSSLVETQSLPTFIPNFKKYRMQVI